MAQDLAIVARSRQLTISSPEQKKGNALAALSSPMMLPSKALETAKRLIGNFPRARPQNPDQYIAAIGAVLAQYPSAVAEECADPRHGIAKTFKYEVPNVADVVEWCDARMKSHELWATWKPRPPALPEPAPHTPEMAEKVLAFLRGLADRLRVAPDPFKEVMKPREQY